MNTSSDVCASLYSSFIVTPLTSSALAVNYFLLITTPIIIVIGLLLFRYYQNRFVLLRKRSLSMATISALGALASWASTCMRDAVDPMNFNCVLFACLQYSIIPLLVSPGLVRLARFRNSVQIAGMRTRTTSIASTSSDINDFFLYRPHASISLFMSYVRGGTRLRTGVDKEQEQRRHRNALLFASTKTYDVFWLCVSLIPFIVAFFVKLPLDPYWLNSCQGCDLDIADVCFFMASTSALIVLGLYLLYPLFSAPDPLMLLPEFFLGTSVGILVVFGLIMHLTDPTGTFHRREIDWRWFVSISCTLFALAQTLLPLYLAIRNHAKLLSQTDVGGREKLMDVLNSPSLKAAFYRHLTQECSIETILFIDQVQKYQKLFGKEGSNQRARQIFDVFVIPGSMQEINVSSRLRHDVIHKMEKGGDVDKDVFDDCHEEVLRLLETDSLPRFLASKRKDTESKRMGVVVTAASSSST